MECFIGEVIAGRYVVRSLLAADHAWNLYEVWDNDTKLKLFLKSFKTDAGNAKQITRMKERADKAIELNHENIMPLYTTGVNARGALYLIHAFSPGTTLKELFVKGSLAQDDLLSIFIQIAQALAFSHQNGRFHGNLTPSSIWVSEQSGIYHAKLMSFELDELFGGNVPRHWLKAVKSAELAEQVLYVSPEQCREGALTAQTDIYSFGCVMFEGLAGHPPFRGTTLLEVMRKHIEEGVPCFATGMRVSRDLENIVHRCLSKDHTTRYGNAEALIADLQNVQDGNIAKKAWRISIPALAFWVTLWTRAKHFLIERSFSKKTANIFNTLNSFRFNYNAKQNSY